MMWLVFSSIFHAAWEFPGKKTPTSTEVSNAIAAGDISTRYRPCESEVDEEYRQWVPENQVLNLLILDVKNKLHDPRRWDPPTALHGQCFFRFSTMHFRFSSSLMIVGHHFDHLGSKVADLEKTQSSILNNPLKDMPEEVQTWMRTSWSLNWEMNRESVTVQGKNPCHVDLISSCSVVLWGFIGKSQVLRLRRSLSSVRILMHWKIRSGL